MRKFIYIFISFVLGVVITLIITNLLNKTHNTTVKSETNEKKVLFWYDPMYPDTKFDAPGPSPFMDMDLVPKYAEDSSSENKEGIYIDPTQVQNLGLKTSEAKAGQLEFTRSLPAVINYNEHNLYIIQPRAQGFVEKIYPFTVGDKIKKGDKIAEITVPSWVEAQSEYILLKETNQNNAILESALERLRLLGMPNQAIELLKKEDKVQTKFTITAPIDGVITAFDLRSGMNFSTDATIATIQSINPIWINAYIPESISLHVNKNTKFSVDIPSLVGKNFKILKTQILPSADTASKSVMLRLEIDNSDERLKPGLNAYINLKTYGEEMLLIPSRALIDTGMEQRVITINKDGRFVPRLVKIGSESNGKMEVLSGLNDSEIVVETGAFLIDSEASISGALERMRGEKTKNMDMKNPHEGH
ncbi:MAG: efflux RND transporter periplasmic adaptor subunit [Campylobacteraceae bacterium]